MNTPTAMLAAKVDGQLMERVRERAQREERTVSGLIRLAVLQYLDRHEP